MDRVLVVADANAACSLVPHDVEKGVTGKRKSKCPTASYGSFPFFRGTLFLEAIEGTGSKAAC